MKLQKGGKISVLFLSIASLLYAGCDLKSQFTKLVTSKTPSQNGQAPNTNGGPGNTNTNPSDSAQPSPSTPIEVGDGKAPPASGTQVDPCIAAGTCPTGKWINVTPSEMHPDPGYGVGGIVVDPNRPAHLYAAGGTQGLWKSTDYGATWKLINTDFGYNPHGVTLAVARAEPEATVWVAGYRVLFRSTNGGKTFERIDVTTSNNDMDLYSFQVDPYNPNHLISGFHEGDGVWESTDSGYHWKEVGISGANWPASGVSWYPYFIDTGLAQSTRGYWFAIAQGGGQPVMTLDGGGHWFYPKGLSGLLHPHGTSQIHQIGGTLYVSGEGSPPGVYRSTNILDPGVSGEKVQFTHVAGTNGNGEHKSGAVWGTSKAIYSMYGWACGLCNLNDDFWVGSLLAPTLTLQKVSLGPKDDPTTLHNGPNNVAVTNDGKNSIFVGSMWSSGIWRYIEP